MAPRASKIQFPILSSCIAVLGSKRRSDADQISLFMIM
jgi:hypothetical protein